MQGLSITLCVLTALVVVLIAIWAIGTKAPWFRIKEAALYAAFGIGATFALFLIAAWFQNLIVTIAAFFGLAFLSFHVAKSLNQL